MRLPKAARRQRVKVSFFIFMCFVVDSGAAKIIALFQLGATTGEK
jgi:hypothetical protein